VELGFLLVASLVAFAVPLSGQISLILGLALFALQHAVPWQAGRYVLIAVYLVAGLAALARNRRCILPTLAARSAARATAAQQSRHRAPRPSRTGAHPRAKTRNTVAKAMPTNGCQVPGPGRQAVRGARRSCRRGSPCWPRRGVRLLEQRDPGDSFGQPWPAGSGVTRA
jgi:hypothetical protein